jgi:transposase
MFKFSKRRSNRGQEGRHGAPARYTLEFKLEAVRLVKGGQDVGVTAKILGMPKQTLGNWVRLSEKGQLRGAGDKPVSAEQMELARLRAELARVKMERDILKKRRRTLQRIHCEVPLDREAQSGLAGHVDLRGSGGEQQWLLRASAAPGTGCTQRTRRASQQ